VSPTWYAELRECKRYLTGYDFLSYTECFSGKNVPLLLISDINEVLPGNGGNFIYWTSIHKILIHKTQRAQSPYDNRDYLSNYTIVGAQGTLFLGSGEITVFPGDFVKRDLVCRIFTHENPRGISLKKIAQDLVSEGKPAIRAQELLEKYGNDAEGRLKTYGALKWLEEHPEDRPGYVQATDYCRVESENGTVEFGLGDFVAEEIFCTCEEVLPVEGERRK
jgi:hypothetical protein